MYKVNMSHTHDHDFNYDTTSTQENPVKIGMKKLICYMLNYMTYFALKGVFDKWDELGAPVYKIEGTVEGSVV